MTSLTNTQKEEKNMNRVLVWYSCGAASAIAAKLAIEKYGDAVEILYCDTLAYEHPDNVRFMKDCEKWYGREIKILKSEKYTDIYDVFYKTKYLVGPFGARCTTELKKVVRKKYQKPSDVHVFGFTSDEQGRVDRFNAGNPELLAYFPLVENNITKKRCCEMLRDATRCYEMLKLKSLPCISLGIKTIIASDASKRLVINIG